MHKYWQHGIYTNKYVKMFNKQSDKKHIKQTMALDKGLSNNICVKHNSAYLKC